jgi:hypothetical protein
MWANQMLGLLFGLIFALGGLWSLATATFLWERMRDNDRVRAFSALLTPIGARIFYVLLGVFFLILGWLFASSGFR